MKFYLTTRRGENTLGPQTLYGNVLRVSWQSYNVEWALNGYVVSITYAKSRGLVTFTPLRDGSNTPFDEMPSEPKRTCKTSSSKME